MATFTLSGTGTHALTAGTGSLHITITAIPTGAGHGDASPTDYYGVGLLRAGDGTGYWDPYPVLGGPQWMPLPTGATVLSYALPAGVSLSVTEVAAASPLSASLAGLSDVTLASLSDAQVLTYQASSAHWINATPTGSGGSLSIASAALSADVSIASARTWYTALSVSLAAGTWVLLGQLYVVNPGSGTDIMAQLIAGSTVYSSTESNIQGGGNGAPLKLHGVAVLTSTTSVLLQASIWGGSATVKAAIILMTAGNTASQLLAVKVA